MMGCVKIKLQHSIEELRRTLDLQHIEEVLRWDRLRLSGNLYQQEEPSWMKNFMNLIVDGPTSWGWPKLRWKDMVNSDLRKKCLSLRLASDRLKWRNAFKRVTHKIGFQSTLMKETVSKYVKKQFYVPNNICIFDIIHELGLKKSLQTY